MTEKRFQKIRIVDKWGGIYDSKTDRILNINDVEHKLNDQQSIIFRLQDLCGESDGENMKIKIENKKLQAENNELQRKLLICSAHLLSDECALTDGQIRKIMREMENEQQ